MNTLGLMRLLGTEQSINYDTAKVTSTALQIPNDGANFFLNTVSAGTAVATLVTGNIDPGRVIIIHNTDSDAITITNTAYGSLAAGNIFCGSGDYTLTQGFSIVLQQTANGWWRKLGAT